MDEQEVVREFLIESTENLNRLDREVVELERRPGDKEILASIFRTIHTIKGTCGFLGFEILTRVSHCAENLLSQVRGGERAFSAEVSGPILEAVDAIRAILISIECDGTEGRGDYARVIRRLEAAQAGPLPAAAPPAAGQSTPPAPPESEHVPAVADTAIRIEVGLLDRLMNLVGELVLARNQILQFNSQNEDAVLNATSQRLNLITTELQENVMKTRMQPIGVVWNKLPRLVRDLALTCGKQIRLETEGSETEMDKTIIEAIRDPLTHLVRNACDHGIERPEDRLAKGKKAEGTLSLRAYHEGGQVNIEIADDGAGMDAEVLKQKALEKGFIRPEQAERMTEREALQIIFLHGFSTAEKVNTVSGRGVGMDVVKSNVEKIGGTIEVGSRLGLSMTVKLKIPLTLAIIPGLVVTSGGETFVIPQASLLELIRMEGDAGGRIEQVHGTPVYRRRGKLLPVAFLNQVLALPGGPAAEITNIVVLQAEDRQFGLVVDSIRDTQEIVVKPLAKQLKGISVYAGATIMGDGRVALILDVLGIGQKSGVIADRNEEEDPAGDEQSHGGTACERLLVFRAGNFARVAVSLGLVARLEEFPASAVEHAAGWPVVQYRGGILPLVTLASVLEPDAPPPAARDPLQVVVFADAGRRVGIVVDEIVDIVEDTISVRRRTSRAGLLGSGIVGKQVADLLDVRAVLEMVDRGWMSKTADAVQDADRTVLIADGSAFLRGLLRIELEMAGYRVREAGSCAEAQAQIQQQRPDVVLASAALPPDHGLGLREWMRDHPAKPAVPILELGGDRRDGAGAGGRDGRSDRDSILESIEKLAAAIAGGGPTAAVAAGRQE